MEMRSPKEQEIKNEDRKAGKKLIIIVLFAAVIGGFFGGFSVYFAKHLINWIHLGELETAITGSIIQFATYFYYFMNIFLSPILIIRAFKYKKAVKTWDGEEEEVIEKLERSINKDLLTMNIQSILNVICYGVSLYQFTWKIEQRWMQNSLMIVSFVFFMISTTFIQKSNINCIKKLNPEKVGSVFDMKFNKKWLESCDEAEQYIVAKTSDKTLRIMNRIYLVSTITILVLGFTIELGILPFILISGMWLTQTIVYTIQALKEKQRMPIIF